jgi:(2Fe-2S) ferredoxin
MFPFHHAHHSPHRSGHHHLGRGGHRGGWLARFLHGSGRDREDTISPAMAESSAPSLSSGAAEVEPVRLFACVGKACGNGGGSVLIDALRREIAQAGPNGAAIDVRPCGCLDQCGHGPVVVAYGGKAAQSTRPPKGSRPTPMSPALGTFTSATPESARRIIDTVIARRGA